MEAGRPWSWSYRRLWASLNVGSFERAASTVTQVISSLLGKACRKLISETLKTLLMLKKKKKSTQTMFPFLFDVSKCKKVKILTPVRMRPQDHAKHFFLFCFPQCDWQRTGWHVLGGKNAISLQKPHTGQFLLFCKSITTYLLVFVCVCVLLGRHMELKNLAAQFHSATSQISTNSSFSTAHCRGLRW